MIFIIITIIVIIIGIIGGFYYYMNKSKFVKLQSPKYSQLYNPTTDEIADDEIADNEITDEISDKTPNEITDKTPDEITDKTDNKTPTEITEITDKTDNKTLDETLDETPDKIPNENQILTQSNINYPNGNFEYDNTKLQDTAITIGGELLIGVALDTIAALIDNPKEFIKLQNYIKKSVERFIRSGSKPITSMINAHAETKSLISKLSKTILIDRGNALRSVYSVGKGINNSISNTVDRIGKIIKNMHGSPKLPINLIKTARAAGYAIETSAQLGIQAGLNSYKSLKQALIAAKAANDVTLVAKLTKATEAGAQAAITAAKSAKFFIATNPATVILLAFQIINMAVDVADPAGYNLLDKWKEINESVKHQVENIINQLEDINEEPINYPTVIGPLDILSLTPIPSSSLYPGSLDSNQLEPGEDEDDNENIDEDGPTMLKYLVKQEFIKMLSDKNDKDIKPLYTLIAKLIQTKGGKISEDDPDFVQLIYDFIENNLNILEKKAINKLCVEYGGILINNGAKTSCMFTKQNCKNIEPPPPPPNCKKIPDPNQNKCKADNVPINWVCDPSEMSQVADYDIMKAWSDNTQRCVTVNANIKAMCDSNGMAYDIDKDICLITDTMCLSKAGKPVKLSDGTLDCKIPITQSIVEGVFGKTLTNSLIQTFDKDQYEECKAGYIDAGKDGPMGELNKVCDAGNGAAGLAIGAAVAGGGGVAACAVGKIANYFCRKKCGPDENEVLGVCWPKNPRLSNPPCDKGYTFDGVSTCNAKNHNVKLTLPIPSKCPDGYKLQGAGPLCQKESCQEGDKDNGLLCQEKCRDGYKDNGAGLCISDKKPILKPLNREPCDKGYVYDGVSTCRQDKLTSRGVGIAPESCDNNYKNVAGICWEQCNSNSKDKGTTCEECPSGYINNNASLCYESCNDGYTYDGTITCNFNHVTVGAGTIPNQCPNGYKFFGGMCYKDTCESGYTFDGMMTCNRNDKSLNVGVTFNTSCPSGWTNTGLLCSKFHPREEYQSSRDDPCSDLKDVTYHTHTCTGNNISCTGCGCIKQAVDIDNSACNDLKDVIYTVGKCAGQKKTGETPIITTKLCKSCTYDSFSWGCNAERCGTNEVCVGGDCMPGHGGDCGTERSGCCGYLCSRACVYDKYCMCSYRSKRTCTTTDKCCNNGLVTSLTGVNCDKCGTYDNTTGGDPIYTTVTRDAPRTCPSGQRSDGTNCWEDRKCTGGVVTRPLTREPCRDGFTMIADKCVKETYTETKPAEQTCPDGKTRIGELCYNTCERGYKYNDPNLPVSCVPNNDKGVFYTQTDTKKPTCPNDKEEVDGLCYSKCKSGTTRVPGAPTQCQGSRGLSYQTKTRTPTITNKKSHIAKCLSNREKYNSLCYLKCEEKFGECYKANLDAPTECMPLRGLTYMPNVTGCPDGYIDNGAGMCSTSYVPKTYGKKIVTADCTGDRDQINGSCYERCQTNEVDSNGNKIQLKHLDGLPTQCVPLRGLSYPAILLSYVPETYAKKRKVPYSQK